MTKPTPLRLLDTADPGFDHPAPHDIGAEQIVLGAVMVAPPVLEQVRQIIATEAFYRPAHARIWEAITTLADAGQPYHVIPVAKHLAADLGKVGGGPYLHQLIAAVPSAANAGYYAVLVRDLAYARHVTEAGARLITLGHAAALDGGQDLRRAVTAELAALTGPDVHGWPAPTPLTAGATSLPAFPVWALPGWIGEYAAALAEVTQTPIDLPGCLALAVLAVAAAGKVWIQAPAWREPANLFIVVVLPPGNRKSEVYRAMCAPINAAETALIADAEPVIAEAAIARRIAEAEAERTAKAAEAAAAGIDETRKITTLVEATDAKQALDAATIPPEPQLFSDDATVERLTSLVAEQGGRMAVLSPEGEIFSIAAGRYSGAPNFGVLKKGHAGEEMRVDRTTRGRERVDAATVTLGICTQPAVLADLGDTPAFRGQGLLGRILYSVPESLLGRRRSDPDPMPAHLEADYHTTLKALVLSLARFSEPVTLTLTDEAAQAVTAMLADIEPRFTPGTGDLAHMTDWGGKLVGATVRIAGLLHLAKHLRDGWNQPINADTFADARDIAGYFTAHAKAAYDTIGADPATTNARAILDWAHNTATTRFTARDVLPALRHRFKKVTDLDPALRVLETHGWIRRLPTPPRGRGRPTAPAYEVHPDALTPADSHPGANHTQ